MTAIRATSGGMAARCAGEAEPAMNGGARDWLWPAAHSPAIARALRLEQENRPMRPSGRAPDAMRTITVETG